MDWVDNLLLMDNTNLPPSPLLAQYAATQAMSPEQKFQLAVSSSTAAPRTAVRESSPMNYEAEFEEAFNAGMQNRQRGVDDLKAKLAAHLNNAPGMLESADLRPMLAFADQLTGGNSAAAYSAPTAKKDHQAMTERLSKAIQDQESGLSEDQLNYLKTKAMEVREARKFNALMARSGEKLTPGQQKLDQEFAKTYEDWNAQGGFSTAEKSISALDKAAELLKTNPSLSGGKSAFLPEFGRKLVAPDSVAIQQDIDSAIQSSLKAILGAQFTENEAKQMLARAYDPALPADKNIPRLQAEAARLREMARQKDAASQYFERSGTLKGYTPSEKRTSGRTAEQEKRLQELLRKKAGK